MSKINTVLGIHDGHNAAAALLVDGRIVGALQEERLVRIKNQGGVPQRAIRNLMENGGANRSWSDIDMVALNGNYMTHDHWDRDSLTKIYEQSGNWVQHVKEVFKGTAVDFLYRKRKAAERANRFVSLGFTRGQLRPVDHHTCHAAAAYFGSGWEGRVLVLTCDGTGDRLSATVSIGEGGKIQTIATVPDSDSIGHVYAMVTFYMGMMPLEHEYKIMGLAPYVGDHLKTKGSARLFSNLFEFDPKNPLVWRRRKGVPPMYAAYRMLCSLLHRQRFDVIASGLQQFTEDILTQWVRNCIRETGIRRVACSGGVFMNVKANKCILAIPELDELFVFPSCGDETNSVGSAYWVYAQELRAIGKPVTIMPLRDLYWGHAFSDDEVETALKHSRGASTWKCRYVGDIERVAAESIAKGEIVARAKGRMEFGARSLGNRSILARADRPQLVREINDMIKCRDFWMPFAPSVLAERAGDYYVKPKAMAAPYMIIAFDSRPQARQKILAVQHPYDFSVRPQEVTEDYNSDYYRLLKYYEELTGEGIILNTSFNLHGFPVVCSPTDALEVFECSGLRYLALGNWWIWKE